MGYAEEMESALAFLSVIDPEAFDGDSRTGQRDPIQLACADRNEVPTMILPKVADR